MLSGEATGLAKVDTDHIGMIRALRVARRSAMKMRTQSFQQMKALIVTAPAELREQVRSLSRDRLVDTAACLRPGPITSVAAAVKLTPKCLAQRHQMLATEIAMLDRDLDRLVLTVAPALCALKGVGTDVAGAVLVAVGDNPQRLRSEGAFANLCGVAPLPASSGKTTGRHRLNRERATPSVAARRCGPSLRCRRSNRICCSALAVRRCGLCRGQLLRSWRPAWPSPR